MDGAAGGPPLLPRTGALATARAPATGQCWVWGCLLRHPIILVMAAVTPVDTALAAGCRRPPQWHCALRRTAAADGSSGCAWPHLHRAWRAPLAPRYCSVRLCGWVGESGEAKPRVLRLVLREMRAGGSLSLRRTADDGVCGASATQRWQGTGSAAVGDGMAALLGQRAPKMKKRRVEDDADTPSGPTRR